MTDKGVEKEFDKFTKKASNGQEDKQGPPRVGTVLSSVPRLISELSADKEEVDWIWEGYLAKGHVTLLSALWKSGKSTLIGQLLKCIQEEKSLAGQETSPTKILILSEESEFLWARRRSELDLTLEAWVVCRPIKKKLSRIEWEKFLEETAAFCEEKDISLVIIDTLSGFWNVDNENDAARVGSALLPINNFLEKNIAVFLIHHFRKSGGTEGTAARGSGALASYVDISIEFSRLDKESPTNTQRVLRSYTRFEETPPEVVIEMMAGEYLTRGTRSEVSKEARLQSVTQILRKNPEGLTSQEIFDTWDDEEYGKRPTARTIRRYLDNLLYEDRVKELGKKIVGTRPVIVYGKHGFISGQDSEKTNVLMSNKNNNIEADISGQDTPLSIGKSSLETSSSKTDSIQKLKDKAKDSKMRYEHLKDTPLGEKHKVRYETIKKQLKRDGVEIGELEK
jgi:hypothetical protein